MGDAAGLQAIISEIAGVEKVFLQKARGFGFIILHEKADVDLLLGGVDKFARFLHLHGDKWIELKRAISQEQMAQGYQGGTNGDGMNDASASLDEDENEEEYSDDAGEDD